MEKTLSTGLTVYKISGDGIDEIAFATVARLESNELLRGVEEDQLGLLHAPHNTEITVHSLQSDNLPPNFPSPVVIEVKQGLKEAPVSRILQPISCSIPFAILHSFCSVQYYQKTHEKSETDTNISALNHSSMRR